ncbi:MAG TPA: ribosome biogenesis GTPase Der [Thermoanaerobaculia bacterium]|nr:ribosome biogenesis GTPase Der [Thermoanaerobaculia bacterium]
MAERDTDQPLGAALAHEEDTEPGSGVVLPPVVAIVGRPNVGKSTLFNRLVGARRSIVHDRPGVTRDRVTGICHIAEDEAVELIDTGGLVPHGDDPLGINQQVLLAVEESDALVLVVDGKQGATSADEEVWAALRRYGRPTVVAVNKGDTHAAQEAFAEFYALGAGPQVLVSAEHALGISELLDTLVSLLPRPPVAVPRELPALAIVGRPNVGKSSLVNRLLGIERSLVSPVPGTTRDPLDTPIVREGGGSLLLIDTAGIRRRSQVSEAAEELAVMMAKRQIARADVAALVVDAGQGITSGDLAIAGAIWDQGRAAMVVVNKWDLLGDEDSQDPEGDRRSQLERDWERLSELLREPPRINVSAVTGRGAAKILPAFDRILERHRLRVPTAELNRRLEGIVARHHAPAAQGREWKFRYATQVSTSPPTFMLFTNRGLPRQHPYRRYLENSLRGELGLEGVPIRLVIRQRQ